MDVNLSYRDWLVLGSVNGLGPLTCQKLLNQFESPGRILESDASLLKRYGLNENCIDALHNPDTALINRTLDWLDKPARHLITINDADYPALLKKIESAPAVLFAVGNRQILNDHHFAIVGSRNPSSTGRRHAESFAQELASSGLTICSGLALGIDYHSHIGALKAGRPTVAVLGNGLNIIYPRKHKNVAGKITENGLLISEFFPDVKPLPGHFPQRNRIISGMSTGVLVVEAAKKSGSLITANFAINQGREVFAIPDSIQNPLARGTHSLIKQGAKLVETAADIIEELVPMIDVVSNSQTTCPRSHIDTDNLDPDCKRLLDSIGYDAISVDQLVKTSGLTADVVSSMLLILELDGIIESRHGGKFSRC